MRYYKNKTEHQLPPKFCFNFYLRIFACVLKSLKYIYYNYIYVDMIKIPLIQYYKIITNIHRYNLKTKYSLPWDMTQQGDTSWYVTFSLMMIFLKENSYPIYSIINILDYYSWLIRTWVGHYLHCLWLMNFSFLFLIVSVALTDG